VPLAPSFCFSPAPAVTTLAAHVFSSDNPMAVMENGKVVSTSTTQEYAAKYLGASWPCDMNAAQVVR
jgi:hypothetical protein